VCYVKVICVKMSLFHEISGCRIIVLQVNKENYPLVYFYMYFSIN
jgi:hypothetical protein